MPWVPGFARQSPRYCLSFAETSVLPYRKPQWLHKWGMKIGWGPTYHHHHHRPPPRSWWLWQTAMIKPASFEAGWPNSLMMWFDEKLGFVGPWVVSLRRCVTVKVRKDSQHRPSAQPVNMPKTGLRLPWCPLLFNRCALEGRQGMLRMESLSRAPPLDLWQRVGYWDRRWQIPSLIEYLWEMESI